METWHRIAEGDLFEWWKSWEVNLKRMYLCCRYFLPLVRKSETTQTEINISNAGGHNINASVSVYQATRFAATQLNEVVQKENEDVDLVSVVLHPGSVKTELALKMPRDYFLIKSV